MTTVVLRTPQPTVADIKQNKWVDNVPTEIWSRVCELLPSNTLFSFMLITRRFHDIGAYEAYKVLIIRGVSGRRCCVALARGSPLSSYYLTLIRDLTYYAVDTSDEDLSFPLFARVLPFMVNIHTLAIHIAPHLASFFMYCVDRRVSKKPNFYTALYANQRKVLPLPLLHSLTLNGSTSLIPLASFQNLTHLEMSFFQTSDSFPRALLGFDSGLGPSRMRSISVRFHPEVDIAAAAKAISDKLPRLEKVVLEQPNLSVKLLLKHLIMTETFPNLHVLHLNITDRSPKYWTHEGEDSIIHRVIPLLKKIIQFRDKFHLITFGRVGWLYCKGKFMELPEVLFEDDSAWYGNTLLSKKAVVRIWCQLDHVM